jgi:hypothetical protein
VYLTVVFLFIDMFALTILYVVLFIYLRTHLKKFNSNPSTNEPSHHELQTWRADLEVGSSTTASTNQVLTSHSVMVISEPRSTLRRPLATNQNSSRRMNQVALRLLCYPVMYICLTMPVTVARFSQFAGTNWSLTAIHVGAAIYVCSGWVNVLLYTATRKGIISWNWLLPGRRIERGDFSESPYHSERRMSLFKGSVTQNLGSKKSSLSDTGLIYSSEMEVPTYKHSSDGASEDGTRLHEHGEDTGSHTLRRG